MSKNSNTCQACGRPGTTADPVVTVKDTFAGQTRRVRIHRSHTRDPRSGFYRGR